MKKLILYLQTKLDVISFFLFFLIFLFCLTKAFEIDGGSGWGFDQILYKILFLLILVIYPLRNTFQNWNWQIVFVFLAFGLLIRLYWSFYVGVAQTSDAGYYINQGRRILNGELLFDPHKQVGPELMSAIGLAFFGRKNDWAALVPYTLANFGFLPLVYLISKKIFGIVPALVSLFIITIWPEHIIYSSFVTAHVYQGFFLLLAFYIYLQTDQVVESNNVIIDKKVRLLLISGFVFGISQYMRGSSLLFFLAFSVYFLLVKFQLKNFFRIWVGFIFAMIPMLLFNLLNIGIISFSPAQNSGVSSVIGTNLKTKGHYYEGFITEISERQKLMEQAGEFSNTPIFRLIDNPAAVGQWEFNQAATDLARERINANLKEFAELALTYKLPVFWSSGASLSWGIEGTPLGKNVETQIRSEISSDHFLKVIVGLVVLSFVVLLFKSTLAGQEPNLGAFLWGSFAVGAVHMLAEIQSQYHVAVAGFYPIVCGALVFALFNWLEKLQDKFSFLKSKLKM